VIPAFYMMWSREKKHRPELDRAEEYEREATELKAIKHES